MSTSTAYPVSGLKNLGHTCGLNAIVHVLSCIPQFRAAFSSAQVGQCLPELEATRTDSDAERQERKRRIIAALVAARQSGHRSRARSSSSRLDRTVQDGGSEIINQAIESSMVENLVKVFDLMNSGRPFVDPGALYFAYLSVESEGTVAFEELDAPQVLLNLLNAMHQDLVRATTATREDAAHAASLVSHFFRGATTTVVRCGHCGASQSQEHDFQGDIIVTIPTAVLPLRRNEGGDWEAGNLTVVDCMKNFVDGEVHRDRVCPKCSKAGAVSVFNAISDLPEVLVLYLSRGEFTDGKSAKHPVFVDVDPSIDFAPFMLGNSKVDPNYDLRGVVVHHGRGTASGHFTSYVSVGDSASPAWLHCNDTDVQPLRNADIQATLRSLPPTTSQPILLFYVRRVARPTPELGRVSHGPVRRKEEIKAVIDSSLNPLFIDSSAPTRARGSRTSSGSLSHPYK